MCVFAVKSLNQFLNHVIYFHMTWTNLGLLYINIITNHVEMRVAKWQIFRHQTLEKWGFFLSMNHN